jgi:hypothetical protein
VITYRYLNRKRRKMSWRSDMDEYGPDLDIYEENADAIAEMEEEE